MTYIYQTPHSDRTLPVPAGAAGRLLPYGQLSEPREEASVGAGEDPPVIALQRQAEFRGQVFEEFQVETQVQGSGAQLVPVRTSKNEGKVTVNNYPLVAEGAGTVPL